VAAVEKALKGLVCVWMYPVRYGRIPTERRQEAISAVRVGVGLGYDRASFAAVIRRGALVGFWSSKRAIAWLEVQSTKGPRDSATVTSRVSQSTAARERRRSSCETKDITVDWSEVFLDVVKKRMAKARRELPIVKVVAIFTI